MKRKNPHNIYYIYNATGYTCWFPKGFAALRSIQWNLARLPQYPRVIQQSCKRTQRIAGSTLHPVYSSMHPLSTVACQAARYCRRLPRTHGACNPALRQGLSSRSPATSVGPARRPRCSRCCCSQNTCTPCHHRPPACQDPRTLGMRQLKPLLLSVHQRYRRQSVTSNPTPPPPFPNRRTAHVECYVLRHVCSQRPNATVRIIADVHSLCRERREEPPFLNDHHHGCIAFYSRSIRPGACMYINAWKSESERAGWTLSECFNTWIQPSIACSMINLRQHCTYVPCPPTGPNPVGTTSVQLFMSVE